MRVISLVPSWTETLLQCGVNVVGRTRFCIHPQQRVKDIPIVGGTKNIDWQRCAELKPDLVLLDKEENTKRMAQSCPFNWHATHVTSIKQLAHELQQLNAILDNTLLLEWAEKTEWVSTNGLSVPDWRNIFAEQVSFNTTDIAYQKVEYMIWHKPWMSVSAKTYIGSVLSILGYLDYLNQSNTPYPHMSAQQMQCSNTLYLFSSEPFPFLRHQVMLQKMHIPSVIVDGEMYSWFGVRSIQSLIDYLQLNKVNL